MENEKIMSAESLVKVNEKLREDLSRSLNLYAQTSLRVAQLEKELYAYFS